MADRFTETTTRSYGQNIMGSIKGVLVGVVLFILSFPVLWWNQGRTDLGKVAEGAVVVTSPETANDGQLVSVTDTLTTDEQLGDEPYLKPGEYVALHRDAEMYAWVEHKESTSRQKTGGGTETTTTYTYDKAWTSHPEDSSGFRHPEGHHNPPMTVESVPRRVSKAKVGAFTFAPENCRLPVDEKLSLTAEMVDLTGAAAGAGDATGPRPVLTNGDIFIGRGSLGSPEVGDIRISYTALTPGGQVTLFGQQSGDSIQPYLHKGKAELFRLFKSTRDEAIARLKLEYKVMGYAIGVAGFLMMWIGLSMVFGPISAVAGVLPFLGNLSRNLIGCVTFPVAVVLTFLVVMVSKVFHSALAMLILGAAVAVGLFFFIKGRVAKAEAAGGA